MSCKSVICFTISFNVASLVGLIHTKQKAESQTQAIEFYLIVHPLKASTLHYTSKHGWSARSPIKSVQSLELLRDPDRVAERLGDERRDLDLCKKSIPKVKAGVRRLNAYTTNKKEANGNSRRVPT